jgi:topoisomerase-4 subunit A
MEDLILQFGNNSAYGLRKTVIEKFNRTESSELDEELKSTDPITVVLLKTGFLKAKICYSVCKSNADFSENEHLYVNGRKSDKFIFLSSFGKSYTLDGENLVFGSQKGKPFSSYFSLKENEEIVDSFLYKNNEKILLCSSNGYGFFINSDNLISNKKSGKKVFNIKKNDYLYSSIKINKDQKYIFLLTKNKKENRASVISMKDIPTQEKGVGIILFKGKKVSLFALSTVSAKFEMLDNYSTPVKKSLNLKKFLTPRTKNGKIIKYNLFFSSLFRGYDNNFKLIS